MVQKNQNLKWIYSNGGPLIFLAQNLLAYWYGIDSAGRDHNTWNPNDSASDYNRACGVQDVVGFLDVASGHALILGDEPLSTAWWPISENTDGIFVRWIAANNDIEILQSLQALALYLFPAPEFFMEINDKTSYLFDSAVSGIEIVENDCIEVTLEKGTYAISIFEYRPNGTSRLLLHRMTLSSTLPD